MHGTTQRRETIEVVTATRERGRGRGLRIAVLGVLSLGALGGLGALALWGQRQRLAWSLDARAADAGTRADAFDTEVDALPPPLRRGPTVPGNAVDDYRVLIAEWKGSLVLTHWQLERLAEGKVLKPEVLAELRDRLSSLDHVRAGVKRSRCDWTDWTQTFRIRSVSRSTRPIP